ncbi:hypothetical protein FRC06_001083 [Ceratobasidium sp. 370]|nr:hypothetical protein FRC06_001083 [Ceratobasidium sp. 370]
MIPPVSPASTSPDDDPNASQKVTALEDNILATLDHSEQKLRLLQGLASLRWRQFKRWNQIESLERTIAHEEKIVCLTPAEMALERSQRLCSLGTSYQSRFQCLGRTKDLDGMINCYEQAVLITPDSHPHKATRLNNLGASYHRRFEELGNLEDISRAISYKNQAVLLTPDNGPDKAARLSNLGNSYQALFDRLGKHEAVENAVKFHELAVSSIHDGHSHKPALLNNLGNSYHSLFECLGKLEDLERATACREHAILLTPDDHPQKPARMNNLGTSYHCLFVHSGRLEDIHKAISYQEQAVKLTPDGRPQKHAMLNNLGNSYLALFEQLSWLEDATKALDYLNQAAELTPDNHPEKPARLNNLGGAHQKLFNTFGKPEDITKSVSFNERAVSLTPDEHPDKPARLNNLGTAYQLLFGCHGRIDDLDKAASCYEQAVLLTYDCHPQTATLLHNLGASYQSLFNRLGKLEHLNKAILFRERALFLTPESHTDLPGRLNNLGTSYCRRFETFGNLEDIKKAINAEEKALFLTAENHPHKPAILNNISTAYRLAYDCSGKREDIQQAISHSERAVSLTPDNHPDKPMRLNNFGSSYRSLFNCLGNSEDLIMAITYQEQAAPLTPSDHPHKPARLNNLGDLYHRRFQHLGKITDMEKAATVFRDAALSPSGHPTTRLNASRAWAVVSRFLSSSPLEAYRQSMTLLPQVIWLGASVDRRYECLNSDVRDLVTEAACAAISRRRYDLAIEWLEQGRSIIWNQMLQLRTPFDSLLAVDPALAEQLRFTAHELERVAFPQSTEGETLLPASSLEEAAREHRGLAASWMGLLDRIRQLPGFHDFLRPKLFAELVLSARGDTIVVVNVHEDQCDAIGLLPGSAIPAHIHLPSFSYKKAIETRDKLFSSLQASSVRVRNDRRPVFLSGVTPDHFQAVLATLWEDIVRPILGHLGYLQPLTPGGELPHIIWCTTGPLAFLPLHAAGYYDEPRIIISDYVISSYTPTLSALLNSVSVRNEPHEFRGILAVGQAAASGNEHLPGTVIELDRIQEQVSHLTFTRLDDSSATPDAVLSAMEQSSWVHLACHASQNVLDPAASAFQLHGGELKLAKITQQSLAHADFAFLSACQTAMGDEGLPDEATHLAAGMLIVGYSSVVATMWSIKDQDAPLVAGHVYTHMLEREVPDSRKAAKALHKAVARLRDQIGEKEFGRWVPYIHIGH